eukprot:6195343-Pleurochrysis_carterae.AAC.1
METPKQLEERNANLPKGVKKDKAVRREMCRSHARLTKIGHDSCSCPSRSSVTHVGKRIPACSLHCAVRSVLTKSTAPNASEHANYLLSVSEDVAAGARHLPSVSPLPTYLSLPVTLLPSRPTQSPRYLPTSASPVPYYPADLPSLPVTRVLGVCFVDASTGAISLGQVRAEQTPNCARGFDQGRACGCARARALACVRARAQACVSACACMSACVRERMCARGRARAFVFARTLGVRGRVLSAACVRVRL